MSDELDRLLSARAAFVLRKLVFTLGNSLDVQQISLGIGESLAVKVAVLTWRACFATKLEADTDPFMLHSFAAVAAKERGIVSAHTKAALLATKTKGKVLGNPRLAEARAKSEEANEGAADDFGRSLAPVIRDIQVNGVIALRGIARELVTRNRDAAWRRMDPVQMTNLSRG